MSTSKGLPESVDVIVLGTGLPESILAAACARSGLSVLHLDRFESKIIDYFVFSNDFYGGQWASFHLQSIVEWRKEQEKTTETIEKDSAEENGVHSCPSSFKGTFENLELNWHCGSRDGEEESRDDEEESSKVIDQEEKISPKPVDDVRGDLEKNWRRFSLDLSPKILLSCGDMVDILCESDVSRYVEFKCVDRFLCLSQNLESLERVPCSKAEIFQSQALSLMEKRKLMKFLQFAATWQQAAQEYAGFELRPFSDFLQAQGHSETLRNYINDIIAILQPNANTIEGLGAVTRFLESVGRFGNSPFLWTIYGSGELPQCFCRLCAVFSGTYCLNQPIESWLIEDDRCTAVITDGQRIQCKHLITSAQYVPHKFRLPSAMVSRIHRAILISDGSLKVDDDDKEHVTAMNLSRLHPGLNARMVEVGVEVAVAPKGYFVSHITATGSDNESARGLLEPLVDKLYRTKRKAEENSRSTRPNLLWSLHFDILAEHEAIIDDLPANVAMVKGPDGTFDYSSVVKETREIFARFWPDRDFLPRQLKTEDDQEEEQGDGGEKEGGEQSK